MKMAVVGLVVVVVVAGLALWYERHSTDDVAGSDEAAEEVVSVFESDPEMNAAIEKARRTLPEFIAALSAPSRGERVFVIKACFAEGDHVEHMWIEQVALEGSGFRGVLASQPQFVRSVTCGQPVTVRRDQVSDWAIIEGGKAKGGFTERLLRSRLSESEREDYDRNSPFGFD